MALVRDSGVITDFTLDGKKNGNFPKLKEKGDILHSGIDYNTIQYDYFGVYHNHSIHYLSTNPNSNTIVHKIDTEKLFHREIKNTNIPNRHIGAKVEGIRVGNFFWIIGGWETTPTSTTTFLPKTSLWVIDREIWIDGPDILPLLREESFCATAVNSTTVFFFIGGLVGISKVVTYDFMSHVWTILSENLLVDGCNEYNDLCSSSCTCASHSVKSYNR